MSHPLIQPRFCAYVMEETRRANSDSQLFHVEHRPVSASVVQRLASWPCWGP